MRHGWGRIGIMCLGLMLCAMAQASQDIDVIVTLADGKVIVDARYSIAATLQEAWSVMTDFEHMDEFISNLSASQVLSQSGNRVRVAQKGKPSRGLLSFSFDVVREFQLTPYERIHSRAVSGTIKHFEGATVLAAAGDQTVVTYHGESIPNAWIPPVIGPSFIRKEVEEQIQELRAEILRRKAAGGRKPPPQAPPAAPSGPAGGERP